MSADDDDFDDHGRPLPKPRAIADTKQARAGARQDMLALLVDIAYRARDRPRSWLIAVMAASRAIQAVDAHDRPETQFLDQLGDPEQALKWIDKVRPGLLHAAKKGAVYPPLPRPEDSHQ